MVQQHARNVSGRPLPRRWKLTAQRLCLHTGKYVHFTGKAWHLTVFLQFLVHYVGLPGVQCDDRIKIVLWAADNFVAHLHECRSRGVWLTQSEVEQAVQTGSLWQQQHLLLHQAYSNWCSFKLWNIRPKFHLLTHVIDELRVTAKNPVVHATWMDEDWVRKVHRRTAPRSILSRYLIGLRAIFRARQQP